MLQKNTAVTSTGAYILFIIYLSLFMSSLATEEIFKLWYIHSSTFFHPIRTINKNLWEKLPSTAFFFHSHLGMDGLRWHKAMNMGRNVSTCEGIYPM